MKGKSERLHLLRGRVGDIVDGPFDRDEKLKAICGLLRDGVPYYDWVGFYFVDESKKGPCPWSLCRRTDRTREDTLR